MPALAAATAVVGVLCVIDLLLTLGVVRRLREHTDLLSRSGPPVAAALIGVRKGEIPQAFTAMSVDGVPMAGPVGLRMVAVFSTMCSACPATVPAFTDYLRDNRLGRDEVLAIVAGSPSDNVPYLGRLTEFAQVCMEPPGGELAAAFKVTGFPAFCLLDAGGAVLATGFNPAELPAPVPA